MLIGDHGDDDDDGDDDDADDDGDHGDGRPAHDFCWMMVIWGILM